MQHRPKHYVEYAGLRLVAGLINILPYRLALAVGWGCAWISFTILRSRVRTAKQRIRTVFGDRYSNREAHRIAWQSWRNIVFNSVEILRVGRASRGWLATVTNADEVLGTLEAHAGTGKGAIIAVSHMGNWDLASVVCHRWGVPIFSISGRQANLLVDNYLNRLRAGLGIPSLTRGSGTMKEVIRRLRAGQFLAILPDVRIRTEGVSVPFFGSTANVGEGMALFARHTGVPIIPCVITRHGWTRQIYFISDFIWPDPSIPKSADVLRMTTAVLKFVDQQIHADPGQWFWFNRRWILDPIEEPRHEA